LYVGGGGKERNARAGGGGRKRKGETTTNQGEVGVKIKIVKGELYIINGGSSHLGKRKKGGGKKGTKGVRSSKAKTSSR